MTYKIKDSNNEEIERTFYNEELQKTNFESLSKKKFITIHQ